jgi:hypothetical protein
MMNVTADLLAFDVQRDYGERRAESESKRTSRKILKKT